MIYVQGYSFGSKLRTPVVWAKIYRTSAVPCATTRAPFPTPLPFHPRRRGEPRAWPQEPGPMPLIPQGSFPSPHQPRPCAPGKKRPWRHPRDSPLTPPGASQYDISRGVHNKLPLGGGGGMRKAWSTRERGLTNIHGASQLSRRAAAWLDRNRDKQSRPRLFQASELVQETRGIYNFITRKNRS